VLACEREGDEGRPLLEHLRETGVHVPRPDELDDAALPGKLHEVIGALARLRVYLRSTDHLNDRELYRYLWEDMLPQPTLIDDNPGSAWQFDVIGGWSEDGVVIYLRYYADADERARRAADFPDMMIPEREKPPFDRDRHLPRAPWDRAWSGGTAHPKDEPNGSDTPDHGPTDFERESRSKDESKT
jgi:hypothetical protein